MLSSISSDELPKKKPVAGAVGIALSLLAAMVLWLCLGWVIDCYVAITAEDRFLLAVRYGDLASACANAGIAADAYEMAQDRQAYRKWQDLKTGFCRH